jgi:hypothetical protein
MQQVFIFGSPDGTLMARELVDICSQLVNVANKLQREVNVVRTLPVAVRPPVHTDAIPTVRCEASPPRRLHVEAAKIRVFERLSAIA